MRTCAHHHATHDLLPKHDLVHLGPADPWMPLNSYTLVLGQFRGVVVHSGAERSKPVKTMKSLKYSDFTCIYDLPPI